MSTTAHPLPQHESPALWLGRVLVVLAGSLGAVIALALAMAGIALVLAHATARDPSGFYTSQTERFSSSTYALTSEGIQIGDVRGDGAEWALDALDATVRVRVANPDGRPMFIGIAREQAVDRYLTQIAHEEISDVQSSPFSYDSVKRLGGASPGFPTSASFWAATASGPGTQALTWKPDIGRWAVVVMNADGSRSVTADVSVGAKSDAVLPIGVVLLGLGLLGLGGSGMLIWLALREEGGSAGGGVTAIAQAPPR